MSLAKKKRRFVKAKEQPFKFEPSGGNALLSFVDRVRVNAVRENEEEHLRRDVANLLVLVRRRAARQPEQQSPSNPRFPQHFDVQRTPARIQSRSHEKVVHVVARHAKRCLVFCFLLFVVVLFKKKKQR
jgi:hypothetical protein